MTAAASHLRGEDPAAATAGAIGLRAGAAARRASGRACGCGRGGRGGGGRAAGRARFAGGASGSGISFISRRGRGGESERGDRLARWSRRPIARARGGGKRRERRPRRCTARRDGTGGYARAGVVRARRGRGRVATGYPESRGTAGAGPTGQWFRFPHTSPRAAFQLHQVSEFDRKRIQDSSCHTHRSSLNFLAVWLLLGLWREFSLTLKASRRDRIKQHQLHMAAYLIFEHDSSHGTMRRIIPVASVGFFWSCGPSDFHLAVDN